ncbi:MAG: hypothetical protein A2X86_07090 [Bdellovibrionales bacterium GWA2_49_15]|nr:MAG: hypothetical protein A2X86_07090 [Bdellovibrionales bacterium GWA2_49_15]HAZ11959.1 hypothetical protein [Bdellovibrionales bacterium]
MKIFFLTLLFSLTLISLAAEVPEVVVLKVQRELGTGLEQLALTFGPKQIVMTKNSNFMDQPSSSASIGLFHGDYDDASRTQYKMLQNILVRLKGQKKTPSQGADLALDEEYQSPHRIIIGLGGKEITQDSIYYQGLYDLLTNSHTMLAWKKQDVALVQKTGSEISLAQDGVEKRGKLTPYKGPISKFKCRSVGGQRLHCPVSGYGGVYLPE